MTPPMPAPGLTWGIRAGFRDYLAALPDAQVDLVDGATETPMGYLFPPGDLAGRTAFAGGFRARAHGGDLDVRLARPTIASTADGVVLLGDIGGRQVTLARLLDIDDGDALLNVGGAAQDVALTHEGSIWLGGVYVPWSRMDPVSVHRHHPAPSSALS